MRRLCDFFLLGLTEEQRYHACSTRVFRGGDSNAQVLNRGKYLSHA
jgi:hypothetical protein